MSRGKVSFFLLLVLVLGGLLVPAESGAITKIKETFKSIKNYFRHGHAPDEHCNQSGEIVDNSIDGITSTTTTTTDYPRIDIRVGVDESSTMINLATRRLIDPGSNDGCPEGEKMGVGNRCRKSI